MANRMESVLKELRTESRPVSRFAGKRVHFIGIGGCGMSGLARMLLDGGAVVSGSEPKPNPQTFQLAKLGAQVSRDQMGELLTRETQGFYLSPRTRRTRQSEPKRCSRPKTCTTKGSVPSGNITKCCHAR